jgi:outer membrane cobalamin receptor
MFKKPFIAVALAIVCPFLFADETELIVNYDVKVQTISQITPSTVITRQQIEASGAQTAAQILNQFANITAYQLGGPASKTNLRTFGIEDEHVLILLNGSPLTSLLEGETQLEWIDIDAIESIEILSLGEGIIFGSGSGGTVLNIVTRRPTQPSANVTISLGTDNHRRLAGEIQTVTDTYNFGLSASSEYSSGFDARVDAQPDQDGYRKQGIIGSLLLRQSDVLKEVSFSYSNTVSELDPSFGSQSNLETIIQTIKFGGEVNSANSPITYALDHGNLKTTGYTDDRSSESIYESASTGINIGTKLSEYASIGAEFRSEKYRPSGDAYYQVLDDSELFAVYGAWETRVSENVALGGGLRAEQHSSSGFLDAESISLKYQINPSHRFVTTMARSYRHPTLADMTEFDGSFIVTGYNGALAPEKLSSIRANLISTLGNWELRPSVFRTITRDFISIDQLNEGKAKSAGATLEARYQGLGWDLDLGYSYTETKINKYNDTQAPFTPQQAATMTLSKRVGDSELSVRGRAQSQIFSNYNEPEGKTLPGHAVWDFSYQKDILEFEGRVTVTNVTDQNLLLTSGSDVFQMPRRAIYFSVSKDL